MYNEITTWCVRNTQASIRRWETLKMLWPSYIKGLFFKILRFFNNLGIPCENFTSVDDKNNNFRAKKFDWFPVYSFCVVNKFGMYRFFIRKDYKCYYPKYFLLSYSGWNLSSPDKCTWHFCYCHLGKSNLILGKWTQALSKL